MIVSEKRDLEVKANYSMRTFTLRFYYSDGTVTRYRTNRMSKEEFNSCLHNTDRDWNEFLKSDDYYVI